MATWPVPDSSRITQEFKAGSHYGIDIGAKTAGVNGDKVVAATAGKVIRAEYSDSYGNVVYIISSSKENGKYLKTVYAHMMSDLSVAKGDTVSAGSQVGKMNNTGSSDGTHLHFEILEYDTMDESTSLDRNKNVNPKNYVTAP